MSQKLVHSVVFKVKLVVGASELDCLNQALIVGCQSFLWVLLFVLQHVGDIACQEEKLESVNLPFGRSLSDTFREHIIVLNS